MQQKLHKPTVTDNGHWLLTSHDLTIRPIQVQVTLYLGQNRYRKPRCRIGLFSAVMNQMGGFPKGGQEKLRSEFQNTMREQSSC